MIDLELQQQPAWRYCRVRAGEKKPYPAGWQNQPLALEQVDSENIGLLLGPLGNGICAIDFDGTSAWTWLAEQGIDYKTLPTTPTWTSGKPDRCQMAFRVPKEIWPHLKTIKIATKAHSSPGARDGEGFEFRWAGGQSVLPPSIHPDTKARYYWLIKPNIICSELPLSLLDLWVKCCEKTVKEEDFSPELKIDDLDDDMINELDQALKSLKNSHPTLDYNTWMEISFAAAHHVGRIAAKVLLQQYYPEQKRGEYDELFRTWNKSKSPKLGTILHIAGVSRSSRQQRHEQKFIKYQEDQRLLKQVIAALKEKS